MSKADDSLDLCSVKPFAELSGVTVADAWSAISRCWLI